MFAVGEVRDGDGVAVELGGLADRLPAHGQRGDDERAPTVPLSDDPAPFELHEGLAESGQREDGIPLFAECTFDDVALVVEQVGVRFPFAGEVGGSFDADEFEVFGFGFDGCAVDEPVVGQAADEE